MTETRDERSAHYWCGALSQAIRELGSWEKISADHLAIAQSALREYEASYVGRPRDIVAFAVMTANGECMAIRQNVTEAIEARMHGVEYLEGALGHPRAARWVMERMPLTVIALDSEEWLALLEDGTPMLDREP